MSEQKLNTLVLPGYQNSGAGHWQTRWEERDPAFARVQMPDWDHPVRDAWCRTLDAAVAAADAPVMFAAHSLGCLTTAFWASQYASAAQLAKVAGALLVARARSGRRRIFHRTPAASRRCRSRVCRSRPWSWRAATIPTAACRFHRPARTHGAAAGSTSARAATSTRTAGSAIGTKGGAGWLRSPRQAR